MDQWSRELARLLANRTSRRGVIGLFGRGLLAVGMATAGLGTARRAAAATCGGGGCNGTDSGCSGRFCDGSHCDYTGNCTGGYANGWSWYCCDFGGTQWRCQDCCDANNVLQCTCRSVVGNCNPHGPA
jgi:hypothetical protein